MQSPLRVLLAVIIANYLCELIASVFSAGYYLFPHSEFLELVVEPLLFVALLFPFLTFFVYRPLKIQIDEREHAEEALKESERQLRYLSKQILAAQERERRRISRELHDEFGQSLTLMKLQLRQLKDALREDQETAREECRNLLEYLDTTIENVRRISKDLSPLVLEDLGLTAALKWLADNFIGADDVHVVSDIDDVNDLFDGEESIIVYRIAQEGLTNIAKHAAATRVSLSVHRGDTEVTLMLEDDGVGFEAGGSSPGSEVREGLGLSITAERVRTVGGTIEVRSAKGAGTSVTIRIPVRLAGGG
jgi:signal transduction histidine kinase